MFHERATPSRHHFSTVERSCREGVAPLTFFVMSVDPHLFDFQGVTPWTLPGSDSLDIERVRHLPLLFLVGFACGFCIAFELLKCQTKYVEM